MSGTEPPFREAQISLFLTQNVLVGCSIAFPLKINGSSRISLSVVDEHGWRGRLKLSLHSTLHKLEDRSPVYNKAMVEGAAGAGRGGRSRAQASQPSLAAALVLLS